MSLAVRCGGQPEGTERDRPPESRLSRALGRHVTGVPGRRQATEGLSFRVIVGQKAWLIEAVDGGALGIHRPRVAQSSARVGASCHADKCLHPSCPLPGLRAAARRRAVR